MRRRNPSRVPSGDCDLQLRQHICDRLYKQRISTWKSVPNAIRSTLDSRKQQQARGRVDKFNQQIRY